MKSELCAWLTDLQSLASKEGLIVEAQHIDCLEFIFRCRLNDSLEYSLDEYKQFKRKYDALNQVS
jgi:hypothetical protein